LINEELNKGDRVESTVMGFYMGVPGTVAEVSQIQVGAGKDYIIELDTGKRIILSNYKLKRVEE
jgi:hypothetical protein